MHRGHHKGDQALEIMNRFNDSISTTLHMTANLTTIYLRRRCEKFADDATTIRWINSTLLLLRIAKLLVTLFKTAPPTADRRREEHDEHRLPPNQ